MTIETILTDSQINRTIEDIAWPNAEIMGFAVSVSRAIEQAVLQSDHIRNMQGMADCMAMVRHELIEAEVINESVPPMMVANAVLFEIQALRRDAERIRALAREFDRARRGSGDSYMPIWDALCESMGSDDDGDEMLAAIDAAMEQQK